MENQPRLNSEPRGSRIAAVVLTFKALLVNQNFEVLIGEHIPTLSRERLVELSGNRAGLIAEMKKTLRGKSFSTYNLSVYSLIEDTGMAEMRYYHMEPVTQQMKVVSAVVDHEEGEEVVGDQAEERYGMQSEQEVPTATDQDWEDFFSVVQEIRENETG